MCIREKEDGKKKGNPSTQNREYAPGVGTKTKYGTLGGFGSSVGPAFQFPLQGEKGEEFARSGMKVRGFAEKTVLAQLKRGYAFFWRKRGGSRSGQQEELGKVDLLSLGAGT